MAAMWANAFCRPAALEPSVPHAHLFVLAMSGSALCRLVRQTCAYCRGHGVHKDDGAKKTAHCDGALAEMLFRGVLRVRWGSSISGGRFCVLRVRLHVVSALPDACSKKELRADLPDGL
jgi:hypothetical protein